jgi:hypothetical protein
MNNVNTLRRAIESARQLRMPAERLQSNKQRLLARVAFGAAAAAGTTTSAVAATAGGGFAAKMAAGAFIVCSSVAIYARTWSTAVPVLGPTTPALANAALTVPPRAGGETVVQQVGVTDAVAPPTLAPAAQLKAAPARSTRSKGPGATSLAADVQLLKEAQLALHAGHADDALRMLDERAASSSGGLQQEKAAARIVALCELGRSSEARTQVASFAQRYPKSPLLARVRRACGTSVVGSAGQ